MKGKGSRSLLAMLLLITLLVQQVCGITAVGEEYDGEYALETAGGLPAAEESEPVIADETIVTDIPETEQTEDQAYWENSGMEDPGLFGPGTIETEDTSDVFPVIEDSGQYETFPYDETEGGQPDQLIPVPAEDESQAAWIDLFTDADIENAESVTPQESISPVVPAAVPADSSGENSNSAEGNGSEIQLLTDTSMPVVNADAQVIDVLQAGDKEGKTAADSLFGPGGQIAQVGALGNGRQTVTVNILDMDGNPINNSSPASVKRLLPSSVKVILQKTETGKESDLSDVTTEEYSSPSKEAHYSTDYDNDYRYYYSTSFTSLPVEDNIAYFARVEDSDDYRTIDTTQEVDQDTLTWNTTITIQLNEPDVIDLPVELVWKDKEGQDLESSEQPYSATVTLLQTGDIDSADPQPAVNADGETVEPLTVYRSAGWKGFFSNIPADDNVTYLFQVSAPKYELTQTQMAGTLLRQGVILNMVTLQEYYDVPVTVEWYEGDFQTKLNEEELSSLDVRAALDNGYYNNYSISMGPDTAAESDPSVWNSAFPHVPSLNDSGEPIAYHLSPGGRSGFYLMSNTPDTISGEALAEGFVLKFKKGTVDIPVEIVWLDVDGTEIPGDDDTLPSSVELIWYTGYDADTLGRFYPQYSSAGRLTKSAGWQENFSLEIGIASAVALDGADVAGYTKTVTAKGDSPLDGYTITYQRAYTSVPVAVQFVGIDGTTPISYAGSPSVTVTLVKEERDEAGELVQTPLQDINGQLLTRELRINQDYGYVGTFSGVPLAEEGEIRSVVQDTVDGYDLVKVEGSAEEGFLLTNQMKTVDLPVSILWVGEDGITPLTEGLPESVSVILKTESSNGTTAVSDVDPRIVSGEEGWIAVFSGLPIKDNSGSTITYTAEERILPGFVTTVSLKDGFVTITNRLDTLNIVVRKQWVDEKDNPLSQDEIPQEAVFYLLKDAGGRQTAVLDEEGRALTLTLTARDNWTGSFPAMPKADVDGNAVSYSLKEREQTDFLSEINNYTADGNTRTYAVRNIKNSSGVRSIPVTVYYYDANGKLIRPSFGGEVTLQEKITEADGRIHYEDYLIEGKTVVTNVPYQTETGLFSTKFDSVPVDVDPWIRADYLSGYTCTVEKTVDGGFEVIYRSTQAPSPTATPAPRATATPMPTITPTPMPAPAADAVLNAEVVVEWLDYKGNPIEDESELPDDLAARIYYREIGTNGEKSYSGDQGTDLRVVTASNGWKYSEEVPAASVSGKNVSRRTYSYRLSTYLNSDEYAVSYQNTSTQTSCTTRITIQKKRYRDIPVRIQWVDEQGNAVPDSLPGLPSEITVNLRSFGSSNVVKSITLTAAQDWEGTIENVSMGKYWNPVDYSLTQSGATAISARGTRTDISYGSYGTQSPTHIDYFPAIVTLTNKIQFASYSPYIRWYEYDTNKRAYTNLPDGVELILERQKADGSGEFEPALDAYGSPVTATLSKDNASGVVASFINLPTTYSNGSSISYRVREENLGEFYQQSYGPVYINNRRNAETPTPTPAEPTVTPTLTPAGETETPTPTPAEPTVTPTPTPAGATETSTPTVTLTPTPTPESGPRAPYDPSVEENTVTWAEEMPVEFHAGQDHRFTAKGASAEDQYEDEDLIEGDGRWLPVFWTMRQDGSNPQQRVQEDDRELTHDFSMRSTRDLFDEAEYQLYVFFQHQTYDGKTWVDDEDNVGSVATVVKTKAWTPGSRDPFDPKLTDSTVTWEEAMPIEIHQGENHKFTARGVSAEEEYGSTGLTAGDGRWLPVFWTMRQDGSNPQQRVTDPQLSHSFSMSAVRDIRDAGEYNIYVFFQHQLYDGSQWKDDGAPASITTVMKTMAWDPDHPTPTPTYMPGPRDPFDPKLTDSTVTWEETMPVEIHAGENHKFTARGVSAEEEYGPSELTAGDGRWLPVFWTMRQDGSNPQQTVTDPQLSHDFSMSATRDIREAGEYNIYVFFQHQRYNGSTWNNDGAPASITTVMRTMAWDPDHPTPTPTQTVTPIPTVTNTPTPTPLPPVAPGAIRIIRDQIYETEEGRSYPLYIKEESADGYLAYIALFTEDPEENAASLVEGSVQAFRYADSFEEMVEYTGLEPGTYYLAEVDEEGTPMLSGDYRITLPSPAIVEIEAYSLDKVGAWMEDGYYGPDLPRVGEVLTQDVAYDAIYTGELQEGFYLEGLLNVIKEVRDSTGALVDAATVADSFTVWLYEMIEDEAGNVEPSTADDFVKNPELTLQLQGQNTAAINYIPVYLQADAMDVSFYLEEELTQGQQDLYQQEYYVNGELAEISEYGFVEVPVSLDNGEGTTVRIVNVRQFTPTTAPEEPTTAPEEPTTAPEEPTTTPEEPTATPTDTPTLTPSTTPDITTTVTPTTTITTIPGTTTTSTPRYTTTFSTTDPMSYTNSGSGSNGGTTTTTTNTQRSDTVNQATTQNTTADNVKGAAATGDETPISLYILLLALAGAIALISVEKRKSR
ncbi:MAG: Cna B-type domain-containing protein [Blautia sp.]|nr:Cna B-type domain-containing protein [Blautia sp.]